MASTEVRTMKRPSSKKRSPIKSRTSIKTVGNVMSGEPVCIAYDAPVAWGHDYMRKYNVRHLPVLKDEKVAGMLTLADLFLIETLRAGADQAVVADAMKPALVVGSKDDVREVASTMARRKIDAAVVVEDEKVVGVFTTTDALLVLSQS